MDADTGQIGAVALTNANANAVHLNENPVHLSLAVDKSASISMPRKVPWADLERYVNRIGLNATHARIVRRVAILQVIDIGMTGDTTGTLNEPVGDIAQPLHLFRRKDI